MDLSRVHERFQENLRTSKGAKVKGQITAWTGQTNALNYESRLLKVHPRSPLKAGEVVTTTVGLDYVLAEHLDSHNAGIVYRTFRMIRVDEELAWTRMSTAPDAVTGLEKEDAEPVELGTVSVMVDPIRREDGQLHMKESRVRLVCGADLKIGDRVGDYSILFVDNVLGVTVAEAQ